MLSEETFKSIFNNAVDGILVVDAEQKSIKLANKVFCEMTGYNDEEIQKLTIKDLHRERDLSFVMEQFDLQANGKRFIARDLPFRRKNGSVFYADINTIEMNLDNRKYLMGIIRDVTSQKKIKDELSFKTILLETQLETTIDGILVVDNQGKTILFNKRFAELWHIPQELLDVKSDEKMLHYVESMLKEPEKFLSKVKYLYAHKKEKSRDEIEFKDGRFFDRYSSPMVDSTGNYLGRIWYFRDISDYKKAELALRKSEETFRLVTEATNDAIWDWNMVTNEVYRNPRHATMLGYKPKEFSKSQDEWETRIHPDDKPFVMKILKEKMENGLEVEYRLRKKNGDYVWVLGRGKVVEFDEKGKPVRMIGANIDITDRKKTEKALRESEEKYKALVESAGETIAVIDNNGVFLFMNTVAAERLGGKPDDYIGKTMWDLFPARIAERQFNIVRDVVENQEMIVDVSMSVVQKEEKWYETTVTPLKNIDGKVSVAMVIARDITDIKKTNEELNTYRAELAHTERLASLGTLSATAAHELTQPLTVIRLLIENALTKLKKTSSPEVVIDKLKDSLTEIVNITSVVDRLRNFARKSTEKTIREVNLKTIANRIVNLLKESSLHSGVEMIIRDLDALPHIYSHEKDLEQMFFALLDNAIHAAGNKKGRQVIISGSDFGEYVELRFADNCSGIAPENLERIFKPFFTTKPTSQGTGLGLCIVHDIVLRAGGKIRVESELGEGTTFFITLPLKRDMK